MRGQKAEVWVGLAVLIYAGIMVWQSISLEYYSKQGPGAGFFPLWVNGGLVLLLAVFILSALRKHSVTFDKILPKGKDLANNMTIIGAILLFMLLVNINGFIVACAAMMFAVMARHYKWKAALTISLGVSVLLFVIFQYGLEIPLPVGMFGF